MNPTYYVVTQGISFNRENKDKILWSPKRTKNGQHNKGFTEMSYVKQGDIIFHGYNNVIHAVSVATTNVKKANKPTDLADINDWNNHGWIVHLKSFPANFTLNNSILSGKNYKGFTVKGKLSQIYLSKLSKDSITYLWSHLSSQTKSGILNFEKELKNKRFNKLLSYTPQEASAKDKPAKHSKDSNNKHSNNQNNSKGSSILNDQNTQSKSDDGFWGEVYLCKRLQNKYNSSRFNVIGESSIFCREIRKNKNLAHMFSKIHPVSHRGNDSYGCDYLVRDNRKHVKYFIDAKATTGAITTPFFASSKEKQLWDTAIRSNGTKVYEFYRVYNLFNHANYKTYTTNNKNTLTKSNGSIFDPIKYELHPY